MTITIIVQRHGVNSVRHDNNNHGVEAWANSVRYDNNNCGVEAQVSSISYYRW